MQIDVVRAAARCLERVVGLVADEVAADPDAALEALRCERLIGLRALLRWHDDVGVAARTPCRVGVKRIAERRSLKEDRADAAFRQRSEESPQHVLMAQLPHSLGKRSAVKCVENKSRPAPSVLQLFIQQGADAVIVAALKERLNERRANIATPRHVLPTQSGRDQLIDSMNVQCGLTHCVTRHFARLEGLVCPTWSGENAVARAKGPMVTRQEYDRKATASGCP